MKLNGEADQWYEDVDRLLDLWRNATMRMMLGDVGEEERREPQGRGALKAFPSLVDPLLRSRHDDDTLLPWHSERVRKGIVLQ